MNKIEIKDLYLVFGPEKQKAFRMLKERKSKNGILKATNCTVAVKNANLTIKEGEFFVIMGLSGSGKSTLLRCINRLIKPTKGQVLINGTNITAASDKELLEMRRREIAMVFQNFGLLPHRSVLSNIAFGLELQGVPKQEREKKAMKSMEIVGLKGYQNQMVGQLSGGMQQRVGLARALANDPEILLMDEAFSALDPLIRVQMQDEMLALQSKMKKTIVFITHDLSEAIKLGDRIAIMRDGEVVQVGTSEEILTEPANDYVARFVENVDRSKIITAGSIMITRPEIKDLYLVFGPEKQKAFRMLKERKSKNEILKATNCTVAVKNANLTIKEGEFFVIMGLSGSGKSTLLRCINRLIKPTKGQVLINRTNITAASDKELLEMRRREIAMVFQNFGLLPHRSVWTH